MTAAERLRYPPISDYALIGNCRTAALVSRDGSVDWWCPGRFDNPAVLCRLLDAERGGSFRLAPATGQRQRKYRGSTNVLQTLWRADAGSARITDFMPVAGAERMDGHGDDGRLPERILRMVEALSGEPSIEISFRPSFDYARAQHELTVMEDGAVARWGREFLTITADGGVLEADGSGGVQGLISLHAGERRSIALTYTRDDQAAGDALHGPDAEQELAEAAEFWERWAGQCAYTGDYHDAVLRSALVLKLLTYEPTGAIVAAPTTSLPEHIGGLRNWDYRYSWLRDASLMIYSLLSLGYHAEAADFFEWLEGIEQANPLREPRIMYAVDGASELPEITLDQLDGYRGSRPVRVGNAASEQRQLDVFGEVVGSAYLYYSRVDQSQRDSRIAEPSGRPGPHCWSMLSGLVEDAAQAWQQPDRGIWEIRGQPRLFLYSRLRCWDALDRGIKLAEKFRLAAPLQRWRVLRDQVRAAIETHGFDIELGAFTQSFGSSELDASSLVIPRIGFLPPTDPRVLSTINRTRELLTRNGLVDRYRNADGLPGDEASFVMCTYWLVDALALARRLDEAHELFEHVTGYANDLGLLSEEIDPSSGELLGNFPQGFSHMALIGSAVNLAKASRERDLSAD